MLKTKKLILVPLISILYFAVIFFVLKFTVGNVFHILLSHYILVAFILIRYRSEKMLIPIAILIFLIGFGFIGVFINGRFSIFFPTLGYLLAIILMTYKSNNITSGILYLSSAIVFGFMKPYFTPVNMSVIEYFIGFNDYDNGIDHNFSLLISLYVLYIPLVLIGLEIEKQNFDNLTSGFLKQNVGYTVSILVSVVLVVFGGFGYPHRFNSESWYEWNASNVRFSSQHMPLIEELGYYEELSSSHGHGAAFFFMWDSVTLNVTYNREDYLNQKSDILDNYVYVTYQVKGSFDRVVLHEFSTEINGYTYKVVDYRYEMEYSYFYIPYRIALIGFNDETNTIKYLYFEDSDLDYITSIEANNKRTLEDFIRQYFDISD